MESSEESRALLDQRSLRFKRGFVQRENLTDRGPGSHGKRTLHRCISSRAHSSVDTIPARTYWTRLAFAASLKVADVAQLVRAPACHAGGRGFKSRHSRHFPQVSKMPA